MRDRDSIQKIFEPLFPGLMGIALVEVTPERVVATLQVRRDLCTTGDAVHGGALMAFADTLGAVGTFMNLPDGARTTTIESKTNFFRASPPGRLRAEAVPLHVGRRTIVVQTTVYTPDGKRAALVTQTQLVIPQERDPQPA